MNHDNAVLCARTPGELLCGGTYTGCTLENYTLQECALIQCTLINCTAGAAVASMGCSWQGGAATRHGPMHALLPVLASFREGECAVCLEPNAMIRPYWTCAHMFCDGCLYRVRTMPVPRCPLCRETRLSALGTAPTHTNTT